MFLLMMMLKRSKRCHKMRIRVMLLNHFQSNLRGQSSTRYTSNEYVTLTHGEEPECYQESMKSEERQKASQSKLQKCVALSTTKGELGFVQNEHWLFCDSQSTNMMTKNSDIVCDPNYVDIVFKDHS
ncbi:hypothetical protein CR513_57671, partial [Mucuna pruriens]